MKEIEIKIRVESTEKYLRKLETLGAKYLRSVSQKDILFDYPEMKFDKLNQALRLRIEKSDKYEKAILSFKGTPQFDAVGIKTREEIETQAEAESTVKILNAIGLEEKVIIEKNRKEYKLGNLKVALDSLKFGNFVELEGGEEEIHKCLELLQLQKAAPVKEPYVYLQLEWEKQQTN